MAAAFQNTSELSGSSCWFQRMLNLDQPTLPLLQGSRHSVFCEAKLGCVRPFSKPQSHAGCAWQWGSIHVYYAWTSAWQNHCVYVPSGNLNRPGGHYWVREKKRSLLGKDVWSSLQLMTCCIEGCSENQAWKNSC